MPITFVTDSLTNIATTLLSYHKDAFNCVSKFLQNIISITPSKEERNEKVEEVITMLHNGFKILEQLISADKFHEEQIPYFIASGRKIRMAAEKLNEYCSGVPAPPFSDNLCDYLVELAQIHQFGAYEDMNKHIPTTVETVLRKRILNNIFFEEFSPRITNLQIT